MRDSATIRPTRLHAGAPEITRFQQVYSADRPEIFDVIAGMRDVLRAYGERVLIGEIYLPVERLVAYYGPDLTGADLPFNFQLIQTPWRAEAVAELVARYEAALPPGGWPNWVLGNHDQPRIAARVGEAQARIAAMLLLTLRGTPTLYYGDEIGLGHVPIPPGRAQDPWERNEPGHGRDPERTPMQWDDGRTPASPRPSPGCRSRRIGRPATSRASARTRPRCSPCTGACSPCAATTRPWRSAIIAAWNRGPRRCSPTSGSRVMRFCAWC